MAQLPDVFCWIKLIDDVNGKVLTDAATIGSPGKVVVRYVVANDSNKTAGPLTGVGSLYRDGVKVQPGGSPMLFLHNKSPYNRIRFGRKNSLSLSRPADLLSYFLVKK
jgi:hypothetical protein